MFTTYHKRRSPLPSTGRHVLHASLTHAEKLEIKAARKEFWRLLHIKNLTLKQKAALLAKREEQL